MANTWLRLWHDMPNDPKWRTISRVSGQPIALVQAVYLHLLVDASRNVTRGVTTVTAEDLASALDVADEQVELIIGAMQGRVLDGALLTGWSNRQPAREDLGDAQTGAKSAAQRKREQRERERGLAGDDACHAMSRNVTLDKDEDKDKEEGSNEPSPVQRKRNTSPATDPRFDQFWSAYPNKKAKATAMSAWLKLSPNEALFSAIIRALEAQKNSHEWTKDDGRFVPHPTTWINQRRWEDEVTHGQSQHPNGQGPLSAVDRVKQAIAAREAAEARAAAPGQAVAEDDRDLRAPLDGEFWNVA